ncbi:MAG: DUF4129 domain-containing protein [Thermoplasmata archaeon]|nr:DUF4129 domain-containing protein [Thermoplasmata archaeon]
MAPRRRSGSARPSPLVVAVLIGAIVAGLAATFLSAPSSPVVGGRGPVPDAVTIIVDFAEALVLLMVGFFVVVGLTSGRPKIVSGIPSMILAIFLVGLAFLVLVHFLVPGGALPNQPVNTTQNSTGTPANQSAINLSRGNGTYGPLPFGPIPGVVLYVLLGVAVVVALIYLAPALRARFPTEERAPTESAVLRRSLEEALASLAAAEPTDAREIIIGLYARLLSTVAPYLDEVDTATPREIARICVQRFGIGSEPAVELTHLFEEARYSSHPFTDAQVARARRALESALLHLNIRSYTGGA